MAQSYTQDPLPLSKTFFQTAFILILKKSLESNVGHWHTYFATKNQKKKTKQNKQNGTFPKPHNDVKSL